MSEGWQLLELGEVVTLKRGYDLPSSGRNPMGKVPVVSSAGVTGCHDVAMVKAPGVVTGRYGSVGNFFYVTEDFWPLNTTLYVQNFKGNEPHFVYYLLQTLDFAQHSGKTGVPGVNRNDLHKIQVNLPPLPEQRKIAEILGTWDAAIGRVEQLIAALQRRKQGLMQRLLTGQVRFAEFKSPWPDCTLQELVAVVYGKSPRGIQADNGKLAVYGTGGVVGQTNSYLCDQPAVIIGRKGTIDKPILVEQPFWAIDTTFYCLPNANVDIGWFYYAVSNVDLRSYNEASGVPSLSRNTLYSINFHVPELAEQQRIAQVLRLCDEELALHQQKLAALRRQKQGLMQRLLTGAGAGENRGDGRRGLKRPG